MPGSFFNFKDKGQKTNKSSNVKHEIISPHEYRLFVINRDDPATMICTAPSLISCINVVFLADKVGASYHVNCGYIENTEVPCGLPQITMRDDGGLKSEQLIQLKSDVLKTIFHFFESNKIPSSEIKVILALPGSIKEEKKRENEIASFLVEKGVASANISAVYDVGSFSVSSRGEYGVSIKSSNYKRPFK